MRFFVALGLGVLAFPLLAASVTVGCPGGTPGDYPSINAAAAALSADGPHTITVSGTCTEAVLLDQRERLTIQGPATVISTTVVHTFALRTSNVTLRNLVVRGLATAISAANNSVLTMTGVTAENANNFALDVFGGSSVALGGFNAADAVTLRNSGGGMRCESCVGFFAGFVTIENNTGNAGLVIEGGRVETIGQRPASTSGPVQGGPTIIRNNMLNGVNVSNRGVFEMARVNLIQNNGLSGIILNDGAANLFASFLPDGTPMGTTIEGNQRNAVSALHNSTLRATGPNVFQNNGNATVPFTGGISATHSSMLFLSGGTITGSTGPGVSATALVSVRVDAMTISGNTEEGVRLLHGSALESIANNTIPAPSVTCDGTSLVFGNLAGVAAFECEKAVKK